MRRGLVCCGAALVAAVPIALSGQPAPVPAPAATAPETCRMLEAAFVAASRNAQHVVPGDVRPSGRRLELRRFVPDYVSRMALAPGEFADLEAHQSPGTTIGYLPGCGWPEVAAADQRNPAANWVEFTEPVFSTDGMLALAEVSFAGNSMWGHGELCIMRRSASGWSGRCLESWLS